MTNFVTIKFIIRRSNIGFSTVTYPHKTSLLDMIATPKFIRDLAIPDRTRVKMIVQSSSVISDGGQRHEMPMQCSPDIR